MHYFVADQGVGLWLILCLTALVFATCVLGAIAVVAMIGSRKAKQLATIQENQFRQRVVQITIRRRLAKLGRR